MSASLVGSEMCIRDRQCPKAQWRVTPGLGVEAGTLKCQEDPLDSASRESVSYTHLTLPTICSV
eukprot:2305639-Alexandrium_andersonii.AAC.1